MQKELPAHDTLCPPDHTPMDMDDTKKQELTSKLRKLILKADDAASLGLLGSAPLTWKLLIKEGGTEEDIALAFFLRVSLGQVSPRVKRVLLQADLMALPRSDGRVRPVEVPSVVRKISMAAIIDHYSDEVAKAVGPDQHGIKTQDGTALAYQVVKAMVAQNPGLCVVSLDVSGAYSNISRSASDQVCAGKATHLQNILRQWYGTTTQKTWRERR